MKKTPSASFAPLLAAALLAVVPCRGQAVGDEHAISTAAQLAAIANDRHGTYVLAADIDLAGRDWTPICGDPYKPFDGTLLGNGHTISNLVVDTQGGNYAGLFGYLKGTVADVRLANPVVAGGPCSGALAGCADGATITNCSVAGASVTASGDRSGLLVGGVAGGSTLSRCFALGTVSSTGGFVGGLAGDVDGGSALSECFAAATVASANDYSYAGGFAGRVRGGSSVTDCYALSDVSGVRYAGGFVGYASDAATSLARCYAAGPTAGAKDAGAFAGAQYRNPSITNCVRVADGLGDVGAADHEGVDALDAAGMRDPGNFAPFHETGLWTQDAGRTQPYFAWGLVDGGFVLAGAVAGTGAGSIGGLGVHAPGSSARISAAAPDGSFFLGWTGGAEYADPGAEETDVVVDNFRSVTARFGALIVSREQLAGITNDLAGSYALGADIDLSGEPWLPIGDASKPFAGSLLGRGHAIAGLRVEEGADYGGLFGVVEGATLDGVAIAGASIDGGRYGGALAGEARGATTIRGCSASGVVTNSGAYAGLLVGRVLDSDGATFEDCVADGEVVAAGAHAGGLVGGLYNSTCAFARCDVAVDVAGTGGDVRGGFVGSILNGGSASFEECYASGAVSAPDGQYVGGFVGNAARPVSCSDCAAYGDVDGRQDAGGFAGQAGGAGSLFADCTANGDVSASSARAGGFAGAASGAGARFEGCVACGSVSAGTGSEAGGFAGASSGAGIVFGDCLALGAAVRATGGNVGGFVGRTSASNEYARCIAEPAVAGGGSAGGFVGGAEGGGSRYEECEAHGSVAASGSAARVGGFAGQSSGAGIRYALCGALGGVSCASYEAGGFVGYVSGSNDIWRCMAAGAAEGSYAVGGFAGNLAGANTAVRECFALGDATATRAGNAANAGGFAGAVGSAVRLSDSYCLGTVRGAQTAGGFAGHLNGAGIDLARCYAAGVVECAGAYAGAFVGRSGDSAAFTDCACARGVREGAPAHALGSSSAGSSAADDAVAELDEAGFLDAGNFDAFLLPESTPWTQADGVSQPYLAWSAADGLHVYASIGGSARGSVDGAGPQRGYDPGDRVEVTASSVEGFFVEWTGSTPYEDPRSPSTAITLDNHRVAAVAFGRYIATPEELDAVRAGLGGLYGLDGDIDLSGRDWTPLGGESAPFAGRFFGFGHAVRNLSCTNDPASSGSRYRGLFGLASGATLDGIEVRGAVAGYQYVGGLAGAVGNGTVVRDCSAVVDVAATRAASYAGGLVGAVTGGSNEIRRCMAAGTVRGSQYLGGFVGLLDGADTAVAECFALGDVLSGYAGDANAGGFAGRVQAATRLSDSYCLGTVGGRQTAGGFAGYLDGAGTAVDRCYAAGLVECAGTYAGAFVGRLGSGPAAFADCACGVREGAPAHAFGSSSAGASTADAAVAELDEAGFLDAGNFDAFLLPAPTPWTQADGVTQPYLAWSAADGLRLYSSVAGPTVETGSYDPGEEAPASAASDAGFFVEWTGSAPYASRTDPETRIPMDNHRVATARFGAYIMTADELDAVRDGLDGVYGLGADIDLADRQWSPIGSSSARFTGRFYGFGHEIRNMVCTNAPSSDYRGLFGRADGATIEGVVLSGSVRGRSSVGGLVGAATGTHLADCSVVVDVSASSGYAGGLAGRLVDGSSVERCAASGAVVAAGGRVGGLVGACEEGDAEVAISDCRADGFASGVGSVGGLVGCISRPAAVSGCAARGDVRSSGKYYGGFVGQLNAAAATISDSWCSGAVWGTGGDAGSFVGYRAAGAISGCGASASANGIRPFCGYGDAAGAALADLEIERLSDGWPEVEPRWRAATPIATAEELFDVTNHLDGVYRLAAETIDLGGAAWTPIGGADAGFTGEFYGNNGCISNFTVSSSAPCAGLFGVIAGGRVEGVRAFGSVSGDSQAGGFAGRIASRSLVRGCSFAGDVSGASTQVGGFVGRLEDQPSVLECCAVGTVSKTGSGDGYVGGFAGRQADGGYIADCYANVDVDAGAAGYAGGFVGGSSGARIARTYCSGAVDSTSPDNCVGAFAGSVSASVVADSYYDAGATTNLAAGRSGGLSVACAGIEPVDGDRMRSRASFPALDFVGTWRIDEGESMPYLGIFRPLADDEFARWLRRAGLPAGTRRDETVDGIPAAARYLFDIVPPANTDTNGVPAFRILFAPDGSPYLQFAERKNPDEWDSVFTVLASPDAGDWSDPDEYPVDDDGRCVPDFSPDPVPDHLFFRYRIRFGN